jgi:hypothetical protein
MASLRGVALAVVGGVIGAVGIGGLVLGCGDNTTSGEDSGVDGAAESGPDVTGDTRQDTGGDVTADQTGRDVTPDSPIGNDAGREADVTVDVTMTDTRSDSEVGVGTETGPGIDADAGDVDAGKVIPPGLLAYPGQYATAFCTGLAACCGATFDVPTCESTFTTQGYDNTLPVDRNAYSAGNLTFSQTQAAACVAALQSWPCGTTITTAQQQGILNTCHNVIGGTIPIGGTGCVSSFECMGGAFCDLTTHTCTALVGSGGACTAPPTGSVDDQCRNAATGLPDMYCNVYPSDGGSPGAGTCAPAQADGVTSLCFDNMNNISDYACTGRLCNPTTASCAATITNPADPTNGFYCAAFVVDAGGG